MKYSYKILYLVLALGAGLFGGVLHGHELVYCYDNTAGLYTADTSSYILPVLCALAALVSLFAALGVREDKETSYPAYYSLSKGGTAIHVLSGFFVIAGGAVLLYSFLSDHSIYSLLLGAFTAIAGVSFVLLSSVRAGRAPEASAKGNGIVVLFWICCALLYTFMEHPVEPILQVFAYDLLAMCASALAIYCQTGRIFKKSRARLGAFGSLCGITLLTTAGFGRLCAFVLSGSLSYLREIAFRAPVMLGMLLLCMLDAAAYLRSHAEQEDANAEV